MEDKLTKCFAGFRKLHGTRNWPFLENGKKGINNEAYVSVLFKDISNAFDTINHDLMLAKLKAYGFSMKALNLMHNYLKNRKQKVEIND